VCRKSQKGKIGGEKKKTIRKKPFIFFSKVYQTHHLFPIAFLVFTTLERMEGERKETTN
jgi:hypothetical protein